MKHGLSVLIIILFFFQLPSLLSAQYQFKERIETLRNLESDSLAIEGYIALLPEVKEKQSLADLATIYFELGNCYVALGDYEMAKDSYLKSIENWQGTKEVDSLNASRYALSKVYAMLLKKDAQNQLLDLIIKERRMDVITVHAYANVGNNIAANGDCHFALQYLNSVLANSELMKNVDHELIIRLRIIEIYSLKYESTFISDNYQDLENIKKHQFEIESKFDQSTLHPNYIFAMHNNIANVYEAFDGELDVALNSYNKTLDFYRNINNEYHTLLTISNIGNIYAKMKDYKKAYACYQEVIDKASDPDLIAAALSNKGYFLNDDSFRSKIPYFYKAFNILLGQNKNSNISFELPTLEEIRATVYELDFLIYLIDLSSILVQSYKESNDISYLHKAKESIHLIDQLVSRIRYESLSEESTLYWIEKGVDTYMLGVEVCYLLNLPDDAFYFMEKNKALLLQENIKTLQAKWELDIPEETLEKEYSLYYQRVDLYEKFNQNPDDFQSKQLYTQINKKYTLFMDSLESQYPGYSKTKEQIRIVPFDQSVKQYVSDNNCFVEYIVNNSDGYGIFCSTQENILFKITGVETLQKDLSDLKNYWTKPILSKTETIKFQKLANIVFSKLFSFEDAVDKLSGKHITIVADQKLNHIPFEALSVSVDIELADSYLINFSEISYLQSISVAEQIKQKENNPERSILCLAPYEFQLEGLSTLSKSREAIEGLSKFKNSNILVEDEATKMNFLEEINKYEIIHLNTHAGIDSFNLEPWIAFRDKKMSLNELYGKENQAELVVLDACKTNDGKLVSGEGILNLSRGFFYNGTQSVLASNWNVNEKSGNEIIKKFYDGLQKGKTKSKALQLAKIDYLKGQQFSDVLPYYWAAFTLTGNISPVELRRSNNLLSYLGLALLALIVFLFYRARFIVAR